jgi:hypothetical protein
MEQRFNRIEEMLATLIQMVESSNAKLDTMIGKQDIRTLKEGQDRQDRILESVTIKSFEHDTYIRDFKRKI